MKHKGTLRKVLLYIRKYWALVLSSILLAVLAAEGAAFIKLPGYVATLVFLFGFSFHAYISALLYNKFFLTLEERGNGGKEDEK